MLPVKSKIHIAVLQFTFFCKNNKTIISMAILAVAMIVSMWVFASTLSSALQQKPAVNPTNNSLASDETEEANLVSFPSAIEEGAEQQTPTPSKFDLKNVKLNDKGEYTLYAYKNGKKVHLKRNLQNDLSYIKKYTILAKNNQETFGIPASVKLAQGLIETNGGVSKLASKYNNHFGMKCWERECGVEMADDDPNDRFHIYPNVWESFQAHSKLLSEKPRYKTLFDSRDYKHWAYGLKAAGYATNKYYDVCLIALIEAYNLQSLDR